MYILDGIAYAGEQTPAIKVSGIRPLNDFKLWLRFQTGEAKIFDFRPLLEKPAFTALKDEAVFKQAYIDYGVVCWNEGDIDIAPEYLYQNSVSAEGGGISA